MTEPHVKVVDGQHALVKLDDQLNDSHGVSSLPIHESTCMDETHQRLEGLTGGIKHPDLDGGVLAPTEEQLSCLGQTQNSPLQ